LLTPAGAWTSEAENTRSGHGSLAPEPEDSSPRHHSRLALYSKDASVSDSVRMSSTCPARAPVNYDTGEPGAPSGCPSGAPWAHVTVTTDGVTLWTSINGRRIVAAEPVGGRGDDGGLYHRVRPEAVGFVRGEGDREHLGGHASARHDLDNVPVRAKYKPDTRAVAVLRRRATVFVLNL
jgi:hypothetical protein